MERKRGLGKSFKESGGAEWRLWGGNEFESKRAGSQTGEASIPANAHVRYLAYQTSGITSELSVIQAQSRVECSKRPPN